MKCFLLGNGFDLHHALPTRYIDIMRIFNFWTDNNDNNYDTIGDLLENYYKYSLNRNIQDDFLRNHYQSHKEKLYNVRIDNNDIALKFSTCFWFEYFRDTRFDNIGWIDFEKEIQRVLSIFKYIFDNAHLSNELPPNINIPSIKIPSEPSSSNPPKISIRYLDKEISRKEDGCVSVNIDKSFYNNNPYSSTQKFNIDKISEFLYDQLNIAKEIIGFYIIKFIDSVLTPDMQSRSLSFINEADCIINLNYSNTVQSVYNLNSTICHYHGMATENIVLGINSSTEDEFSNSNSNTTFIAFEKYFQRIFLNYDAGYLNLIEKLKKVQYSKSKNIKQNELLIIGHSINSADKDVIEELFEANDKIIVFYHNDKALGEYIKNIVEIFGKIRFWAMRKERMLEFRKLDAYTTKKAKAFNNL